MGLLCNLKQYEYLHGSKKVSKNSSTVGMKFGGVLILIPSSARKKELSFYTDTILL